MCLVRVVGRATMKHPGNWDDNKRAFTRRRFKFKTPFHWHPDNKPLSVTLNYHSRVNHFDDHCRDLPVSGLSWNVLQIILSIMTHTSRFCTAATFVCICVTKPLLSVYLKGREWKKWIMHLLTFTSLWLLNVTMAVLKHQTAVTFLLSTHSPYHTVDEWS
jgi:hypothetical protein